MKVNNQLFFSLRKKASLQVRPKIISPPKAAALAAAAEASKLRNSTPATLSIGENKVDEFLVFLSCPWPFFHT